MSEKINNLGIYKITCVKNNKIYIGKSIDIHRRIKDHKWKLRSGTHINKKLQSDFNKYGEEAFIFEVEKYLDTELEMLYYESYYAEKYEVFSKGYNITKLNKSASVKKIIDNLDHYVELFTKLTDKIPNDGYCERIFRINERAEEYFKLDRYDIGVLASIIKSQINLREGLNFSMDIGRTMIHFIQIDYNKWLKSLEELDI